jgi:hypothetical protein
VLDVDFFTRYISVRFIFVCEFSSACVLSRCAIDQKDGPSVTTVWLAVLINRRESATLNALKEVLRGLPQTGVRAS